MGTRQRLAWRLKTVAILGGTVYATHALKRSTGPDSQESKKSIHEDCIAKQEFHGAGVGLLGRGLVNRQQVFQPGNHRIKGKAFQLG